MTVVGRIANGTRLDLLQLVGGPADFQRARGLEQLADTGRPGAVAGLGHLELGADIVVWVFPPLAQGFHGGLEFGLVVLGALGQIRDHHKTIDLKAHRAGGLAGLRAQLIGMLGEPVVEDRLQRDFVVAGGVTHIADLLDQLGQFGDRERIELRHGKLADYFQHFGLEDHFLFSFFQLI